MSHHPQRSRLGSFDQLQPEVRAYEPPGALFGGPDGLQIVRRLVNEAPRVLAREGVLIFEFGAGQEEGIEQVLRGLPTLTLLEVKRDLQDIPRAAVVARA